MTDTTSVALDRVKPLVGPIGKLTKRKPAKKPAKRKAAARKTAGRKASARRPAKKRK